ncbi:MAG: hypothetical protein COW24_04620 [Candidatus Kerfeldbacteria bacterium CG15_BIG_FIL_POST_REV_8_21_14_020_45_12]|uniref:Thoeris protein ThsB TIR-like domain-containing protein n=1 Tax=Candidatus Kerfeldbacteria bacterium CG15_BIG_FIL_POST_REV_8_21_14_020_45_12 TaxID=2014247 RepID=A0A2M7H305_9BACT|nr:MAG: hypothetical protein COW24_04620 [Candidatus Kerfeldbacteria bacterium CG15_BIG_FIL_POST_REV_8_21_14_020_45_12]PJA93086.1 MAG: hypothetical protein CO132_05035 [Candidatus Kerfeldbacteria bacterium CG_4_9_14_3_um_filter_45_8]
MKRIFIAFAAEDMRSRDFLVGQSRLPSSPFEFVDMSVKEPWDSNWKEKCRRKIKGCDGVVALISRHTPAANGQIFEMLTAEEENIPVMFMYSGDARPTLPYPFSNRRINLWNWENIRSFISKLL